jgi:hypothetical protein
MTPEQTLELRRLTRNMWELLHHVDAHEPRGVDVLFGTWLRTARILARRGFLSEPQRQAGGFYSTHLTDAGREAVHHKPRSR